MSQVLIDPTSLTAIGEAIRSKNKQIVKYKPNEMADAIKSLSLDNSVTIQSNDAWKYSITQKEHQSISVDVSVEESGDNASGYLAKIKFSPSISSYYGYVAGTIRKSIDSVNHVVNITADDATELDGYIKDGFVAVYSINGYYYRNTGTVDTPKLEQIPNNSEIDNLLVLGYYTDTSLKTIDTENTYALSNYSINKTKLKKYINKNSSVKIGNYAFYGCSSLTTVDVSNATSIGNNAFVSAKSFQYLVINNSTVREINYNLPYIYKILVPSAAIEAYKSSNSTISKFFDAIENYTITKEKGQVTVYKN